MSYRKLKGIVLSILTLCASIILINSCQFTETNDTRAIAKAFMFNNTYTADNIGSQFFDVPHDKDTMITGAKGTKVRIYANTFESLDSNEINGRVKVELKEAVDKVDFVMGNLTTTSPEGILESDGMIYLNATANGNEVKIAEDKELGIILPAKWRDRGMKVYEGEKTEDGMSWVNPTKPINAKAKQLERTFRTIWYYTYDKKGRPIDPNGNPRYAKEIEAKTDWFWATEHKKGDTMRLSDFYVEVNRYQTDKVKLSKSGNGIFMQDVISKKGRNGWVRDYNTNYIFSMKKLGWANIDKLYKDKKAQEVQFALSVPNHAEFDYIYTTMVFKKRDIYIPGYQKADNTFSFAVDDQSKTVLPVGEEVTVMATAYKGDQPFLSIQHLKIEETQNIVCTLDSLSVDDFRARMEAEL